MQNKVLKHAISLFSMLITLVMLTTFSDAATFKKLEKPPLDEHGFGIYVGKDRVGFYKQKFTEIEGGYRIDATGGVKLKVMGFSKESSTKETYFVGKNLALRSFDITQTLNDVHYRVTGTKFDTSLRLKIEKSGKTTERQFKFNGDVIPGPALNIFPLMQGSFIGKTFKVYTFDIEEIRIEDVKISVFKEENAPNGQPGLKMRNTLYPFVHNDIWVDANGNTLWESVRDGLVITKFEINRLLEHLK
jgi:hypothetical protein